MGGVGGNVDGVGARAGRIGDRVDGNGRVRGMGQGIGVNRRLLGVRVEADCAADQEKYKQPFDQQPGFLLKCLKNGFIVSNETKSAGYAAFQVQLMKL